jgi:hypothetical protein
MSGFFASFSELKAYDLAWIVPCLVGAVGIVISAPALLRTEISWQRVAVTGLFVGICGASVISKASWKNGEFNLETRNALGEALGRFREVGENNTKAIAELKSAVAELGKAVMGMRLAAAVAPQLPGQPPSTLPQPPSTLPETIRKLDESVKRSFEFNERSLKAVIPLERRLQNAM